MNKINQTCKYFPPQFIIDDYVKHKNDIDKFENDYTLKNILIN